MATNALTRFTINLTNIPWTVGRHELALYFSQFGYVHEAFVEFNKRTGLHEGHGYVTLIKVHAPEAVLEGEHCLEGKVLTVKKSNTDSNNGNDNNNLN